MLIQVVSAICCTPFLLQNPPKMEKAQAEIDAVLGQGANNFRMHKKFGVCTKIFHDFSHHNFSTKLDYRQSLPHSAKYAVQPWEHRNITKFYSLIIRMLPLLEFLAATASQIFWNCFSPLWKMIFIGLDC